MKTYLITDPAFYSDLKSFERYLQNAFTRHKPDFVCFRDKIHQNTELYAKRFLEIADTSGIAHTLINHDIMQAEKFGFWGVHLTSSQFDLIPTVTEAFFTVVSTHTPEEALEAEEYGADAVTISPIFSTPGKGEGKGVDFLCEVTRSLRKARVFALGGIVSEKEVTQISRCHPYGFASIRFFV